MSYHPVVGNSQVFAVVCNQFGDTGKGRVIDYLAGWADVIARGTGGANAGHTLVINGRKIIFHLLPCGILYDGEGKQSVIGNGVAFDPRIAKHELDELDSQGYSYNNLMIAWNAHLVLPQHIVMDRISESDAGSGRIGTTRRGIGPLYTDRVSRTGLVVNDMLNKDALHDKLVRNLEDKVKLLKASDPEAVKAILHQRDLGEGRYYAGPEKIFSVDALVDAYAEHGRFFQDMVRDTDTEMLGAYIDGKRILLEGAQGLMLSVDYGAHPYVTSSDASIEGLAKGVGLKEMDVDLTLGIIKGFYMTRVGEGPFPTEFGGPQSAEWCRAHTKEDEKKMQALLNHNGPDDFVRGIALRVGGDEYGATTGRPRRTGWLDLPMLRHAIRVNGTDIVLTKIDVLDTFEQVKVCTEYRYNGPEYHALGRLLHPGDMLDVAIPDNRVLEHCEPIYSSFDGWMSCTQDIRDYDALPQNMRHIIDFVEEKAGVNVKMLTVGPERDQTIVVK